MSTLANWTYVYEITIWPAASYDEFGQPVIGTPYLIMGDWMTGGDAVTDQNGTEFSPNSTYYFEAAEGSPLIPKIEDFILVGDHTAEKAPPANAEKIRKVGGWGMKAFGDDELPDWRINT